MRSILDTSVVIGAELTGLEGELAVSTVTLAELHFGVLLARDDSSRGERLRRLSLVERMFSPLPVTDKVARSYGQLAAAVSRAGRRPRARSLDLLVAATAHAEGARLYTRNPGDLRGVEHLLDIVAV